MRNGNEAKVADDGRLLAALIADDAAASPLHRPTAYWRPYAARIVTELQRAGLAGFRQNQTILKGYASGGVAKPTLPQAAWKRTIWTGVSSLPGVSRIVGEQARVIRALSLRLRRMQVAHARLVLDRIADRYPDMKLPDGIANGGADDAFMWRGQEVTSDFVMYLSRVADLYGKLDPKRVTSILEIGPGLGLSSLAHVTLNPALKVAVNVDIVPVGYISSRFLASIPSLDVIEYTAVREAERIAIAAPASGIRVYALPPWMLAKVEGSVDLALNAFSFQEMEEDVVRAYAADVRRLTRRAIMLHSRIEGHKAQAGGQQKPVTMAYLESLFEADFPARTTLPGLWSDAYDENPERAVLRSRTS